jgi:hypothetical protein
MLHLYMCLQIIAGRLLSAIFVAGVTGLVLVVIAAIDDKTID